MDLPHGHAACAFNMDMQYRHQAQKFRTDMQHEQAAWSRKDMHSDLDSGTGFPVWCGKGREKREFGLDAFAVFALSRSFCSFTLAITKAQKKRGHPPHPPLFATPTREHFNPIVSTVSCFQQN
jgi:hypothetical protein